MKKLSIVLIAFLLVAGAAFADEHIDFSGEAKVEFEIDFDDEVAKFLNTTELNMEYVYTIFSETRTSAGSPPIWAEIIGTADLYYDIEVEEESDNPFDTSGGWDLDLEIESAKVYFDELDLWIDILGTDGDFQFVGDSPVNGWLEDYDFEVDFAHGGGGGLLFGYQDFEFGVDLLVDWDDSDNSWYFFSAKTPVLQLTPELSLEAMAVLEGDTDDVSLHAGFDGSYAMDGMEYTLAGDFFDNFDTNEILFTADMAPVYVALYFINNIAGEQDDLGGDYLQIGDDFFEALVEVDMVVDGFDSFSAGVENQMIFDDFVNKSDLFVSFGIDDLTAKVFGGFTLADEEIKVWELGAEAGYTVDDWTFGAEVALEYYNDDDEWNVPFLLSVTSTDMFVDNAKLFAEYEFNNRENTNVFTTGISMSF